MRKISNKYRSLPVQVRASFWFLICSFMQKGISVITTPIFTRLMTTTEYGQYGVFNSWYGIVTIFVSLNLFYGVHSQGLIKYSEDRDTFSSSLQSLLTILVICWTIIYIIFHAFFNTLFSLTTVQVLAMLLMVWATSIFNFWANEKRVSYSYKSLVIVTLIASFAKPVLGILLVMHAEDKVTARILGIAFVELVVYSWMYIIQLKRGGAILLTRYWKYALAFNIPLVPHYLSQTVLNSADRIMIQNMIGSSEAGIYNLAYSISLIMTLFNNSLTQTISPWMYQKIKDNKGKDIAPIAYVSLILIASVNFFLILLAPEAVKVFAPKAYYDAIWVIPPVAMSVFFMYSYDLFAKFAFYYEKTKVIMVASVLGAALNVLLNYVFIKEFGYVAAGYTTLVCFITFSLVHYIFMRKVCRECCNGEYPYETKKILMIAIPFLICGFGLLVAYNFPMIRYGIVGVVFMCFIVFRRRIIRVIKNVLNLRKKRS